MGTRRQAVVACIAAPSAMLNPGDVKAIFPLFGIAIRILIGNAVRTVVKAAIPLALSTATRRFLISVAIAYGISEAHAAILAKKAEDAGAETLAKAGVHHDVLLSFKSAQSEDIYVRSAILELVNLETGAVEQSHPLTMLRLRANSITEIPFTVTRFETQGLKQLRVISGGQVFATGARFFGAV